MTQLPLFRDEAPPSGPRFRVTILRQFDAEPSPRLVVWKDGPEDFQVWLYPDDTETHGSLVGTGETAAQALQRAGAFLWTMGSLARMG